MRWIAVLALAILMGCSTPSQKAPLMTELRPELEIQTNLKRENGGFVLGDERTPADWAPGGLQRAGEALSAPVTFEQPVEHLMVHYTFTQPPGTYAHLEFRGEKGDWISIKDSGYLKFPSPTKQVQYRLRLAGNDSSPVVKDLAFQGLPSEVTVTFQVLMLPDTPVIDMSQPLPPVPGARVRVLELNKEARADKEGKVSFTLPLGERPPDAAIYTFEATDGNHRATAVLWVTPHATSFRILMSPKQDVFSENLGRRIPREPRLDQVVSAEVNLALPVPTGKAPRPLLADDDDDRATIARIISWIRSAEEVAGEINPPARSPSINLMLKDGTSAHIRLAYDCTTTKTETSTKVECQRAEGQVIYHPADGSAPVRLNSPPLAEWLITAAEVASR